MLHTLNRWRVVLALAPFALFAQCNFFARFQDCQNDRDCPAGLMCNPTRHYCQTPVAERCGDGVDNDFDGLDDVHDDFGPCEVPGWRPGAGCRDGVRRCTGDGRLTCEQRTRTRTEVCGDGVDDDCNGVVDDGEACMAHLGGVQASAPMRIGSNDPAFGSGADAPEHGVCLADFQIDRHEVTLEAYARFLDSLDPARVGEGTPMPSNPSAPRDTYITVDGHAFVLLPPAMPERLALVRTVHAGWEPANRMAGRWPVTGVTWLGADAYCRWAGKHLPTEAEWWRAARGASGSRAHPWGDEPVNCERANLGTMGPNGEARPCVGEPLEVHTLDGGRSPEGVHHLQGNVSEWVFDWLDAAPDLSRNNYYADTPDGGWCATYPQGPLGPDAGRPVLRPGDAGIACVHCRFARGGDYALADERIGPRHFLDPDRGDPTVGFRCSTGGAAR